MSPEEKNVIGGIFERLKGAAGAPRDPEAERFIADQIKAQPYAPYVMAQAIYAQEQALTNQQQQIEQLQSQVRELEAYAQQAQQQQSGGFLSGLFGGSKAPPPPPMGRAPFQREPMGAPQQHGGMQAGGPWGGAPGGQGGMPSAGPWGQQGQPQRAGGMGFLGTAAMTAAGVAGGMLAANALSNMFSGGAAKTAAAPAAGGTEASSGDQAGPADSQNYGSQAESAGSGGNYDDGSYDGGGDFGGGDDWA